MNSRKMSLKILLYILVISCFFFLQKCGLNNMINNIIKNKCPQNDEVILDSRGRRRALLFPIKV